MSDDGEKKDLTKITDLSEFIHEEDPETDALLENSEDDEDITSKPVDEMASLDELDDDENTFKEASFDDQDEEDDDENDDNEPTFGERDPELSFGSDDDDSPSEESEGPLFGAQDSNFEETSFDSEDDEDNEDEAQDDAFGEQDDESLDEVSFGSEESFEEEDPEPEAEEAQTIPASIPPSKESFDDVRQFAKNISYGVVAAGGNPPYSLIMKNIKYKEDAEDIMIILREHGLVNDSSAAAMQQGLDNGSVLISQISEYSAIYLAHRMRRFDMEVLVGLSEELHSSKTYDSSAHGLVTKNTLKKNRKETMDLASKPVNL